MAPAAHPVPGDRRLEPRLVLGAQVLAARRLHVTSLRELAARGEPGEVRDVPLDHRQPPLLADVPGARDGVEEAPGVGMLDVETAFALLT